MKQMNLSSSYQNPVVPLDYSDPDVIRVELEDDTHYYYAASTFMDAPGAAILHSRDLVNWEIGGYALDEFLVNFEHYLPEHMDWYEFGVYAPAIRYHSGKFYVYSPVYPDGGICVSVAENVKGPWKTEFVSDKNGLPVSFPNCRLTDVCPFWDEDGRAYLILSNLESQNLGVDWQSEAGTKAGSSAQLFRMSESGKQLLDADASTPWAFAHSGVCVRDILCTEGNKIYKKDGWYYFINVCFLGNSPEGKGLYIRRSRNIYGDGGPVREENGFWHGGRYERKFLGSPQEIPTQGAFVDTPDGKWYFMGQMPDDSAGGRMGCLVPVCWEKNEFPKLCMSERPKMPLPEVSCGGLVGSDRMDGKYPKPFWNWNHIADKKFYEMTGKALRIYAQRRIFCGVEGRVPWGIKNILFQKYIHASNSLFCVRLELSGMTEGQEAGLIHFNGGDEFAAFYVLRENGKNRLRMDWADKGSRERRPAYREEALNPPFVLNKSHAVLGGVDEERDISEVGTTMIWLRTQTEEKHGGIEETARFSYSFDGTNFYEAGEVPLPESARFRGDRIGIYTCNDFHEEGFAEFSEVEYQYIR